MINIHSAPDPILKSIFLAGPTRKIVGQVSWRKEAMDHLQSMGFTGVVYSPEASDGSLICDDDVTQIKWVLDAVEQATAIILWMPENMPIPTPHLMPSIVYREKLVIGSPDGKVLVDGAARLGIPIRRTLEGVVQAAISMTRPL